MGCSSKTCAILHIILCFGFLANVYGQNDPSLDWQFDPYSTDQWLKQKQDHYDAGNIQFWPQRYVTSYRFFRLGGPVFLYLSGPGPELTVDDIETGAIAAYAEEQGAFVIGLEHRFYGKSRPTQDLSKDSLKYLTIPQTIEDIASLIRSWRTRDEFTHSKWVVFGASYLGSVAAWFAQKHPELIDAFVASSAPLELRYEIPEFLQSVGSILNQTDTKCYETVAEGFSCLENIISQQGCENYTLDDAKSNFGFCAELEPKNELDTTGVFAELFSTVNAVVMYHDPDPKSFPDTNLDRFCKDITSDDGTKTPLEKLGEKVREINKHRGLSCSEFRFQTTVDFLADQTWDSDAAKEGFRQLQWQLCNELGWTVASANLSQPFGHYLSPFLHSEICQTLFGLTETEMRLKVLQSNTDLKGKNLTTKCGLYINGDHDPWHTYSITKPNEAGKCNRAILIEGGSHGRDVEDLTNSPSYPPQVKDAQLKIAAYLDAWLKTGKCCEDNSANSRPIRTTSSKEYYSSINGMLKPNVQIKPHSYPAEDGEKLLASPTTIPYQVSTTDVLSVSPRIPIDRFDSNMYRDPRNAEFRRYRVVKLLRHRPSFAPLIHERNDAPSMEQFEADFPDHSLRVEGRVERVFKNGTKIVNPAETNDNISRPEMENQRLFERGRRLLVPTKAPTTEVVIPPTTPERDNEENEKKNGTSFRFVVKQVFKDVIGVENTNSSLDDGNGNNAENLTRPESFERFKNTENSNSAKIPSKRQKSIDSLYEFKTLGSDQESDSEESESNYSSSISASEEHQSKEVQDTSSNENESKSTDSTEEDVSSPSVSDEHQSAISKPSIASKKPSSSSTHGNSNEIVVKVSSKPTKSKSKIDQKKEDDQEEDSDYYDEDDYYIRDSKGSGSSEDNQRNEKDSKTAKPSTTILSSTEFSSGEESSSSKRLREKISEKIMSSSEGIEHGQNTKEKTKGNRISGKKDNGRKSNNNESSLSSSSVHSSTEQSSSEEDYYNYSLEPSGSNPQKTYKKKQLEDHIAKPVQVEPSTVINVEISGSYPKRNRRRQRVRHTTTMEPETVTNENEQTSKETTTKKPRKNHRRRRPIDMQSPLPQTLEDTTTTESPSSTTTSTTEITTTLLPEPTEIPNTNNYAHWNRRKLPAAVKPIQQTQPSVVNLESMMDPSNSGSFRGIESTPIEQSNDVVYIIVGDIPKEESDNLVNENPSADALFNFIQKLVNRHSSGIFTPQGTSSYSSSPASVPSPSIYLPPPPPPPSTTTTTPAPPRAIPISYGNSNKFLLVRPVQVVSLGKEHVVHAHDLKNDSLIDLMTMEAPYRPSYPQYQIQNTKREGNDQGGGYRFKSPFHREHFQKLLSVDGQFRDSDREDGTYQHGSKRLDEIPDPSWRTIRGVSQFGPALSAQQNGAGLLSLSSADTMWVNDGVPFIPRNHRQFSARSVQKSGYN